MDIALKQRLVGATILIALAVIFLPLLLDGDNRDGQSTQPIEIPERPDVDFQTRRLPVGDHSQADTPESPQPQAQEQQSPEPQKPEPQKQESRKPEPVPAKNEPAATEKPVTESPPAENPAPAQQLTAAEGNWLVQVGSFGSLDNANRLGTELDGLGYAAMLEAGGGADSTLVRVKIGPFNSEHEANEAAQRVRGSIPGVSPRVISADGAGANVSGPVSGWVVQLGSFEASENASKLSASLKLQGFTVFTDKADTSRGSIFKVRTGPVAERAEAEQLRERIRVRSGTAGMVVNLAER